MRTLQALAISLSIVSAAVVAAGQTPSFDEASVKRHAGPGGGFIGRQPGGRFTAQGVSLQDLIVFAYNVQPFQIAGGPKWLDNDRWDISAVGAQGTPDEVLVALQRLLADRFSLVITREMREMSVYALVKARPQGPLGPQLQQSPVDCAAIKAEAARTRVMPPAEMRSRCDVQGRVGSVRMGGSTLSDFTMLLSTRMQRVVIDRTALTGPWDLTLTYTPEPSQIAAGVLAPGQAPPQFDPSGPSIFTAVQEQLGLKLDSQKGPVAVFVIDRAERPKEN